MPFVNFKWNKPIFAQAAIYRCAGCGHECEMYADFEWVPADKDDCSACGRENVALHWLPQFIYRKDCYATLSMDPAHLPEEKTHCADCCRERGLPDKFHWTELEATCWACEGGKMKFVRVTEGEWMDVFIPIAVEKGKLAAPEMGYTQFVDGHEYYCFGMSTGNQPGRGGQPLVQVVDWDVEPSAT